MSEKNDAARGGVKAAVNNALLAYILYSMQSGTAEKIKSVVRTHFAEDVVTALYQLDAADNLPDITLSAMDPDYIPQPTRKSSTKYLWRIDSVEWGARLSALTEVVDRTVGINLTLKDQMDAIQQDSHASCQKPNSQNN